MSDTFKQTLQVLKTCKVFSIEIHFNEYALFQFDLGSVVVREGIEQLFLLNDSATLLWQHLLAGDNIENISLQWSKNFNISPSQALHDIQLAIQQWHQANLIGDITTNLNITSSVITTTTPQPIFKPCIERFYRIHTQFIKIRSDNLSLIESIDNIFAYLTENTTQNINITFSAWQEASSYYLMHNNTFILKNDSFDNLINQLHYSILQTGIINNTWLSVLHAGAVIRDNKCLVIAGSGGAGKSTLTAALLTRGFAYFCDDLVPLKHNNKIIPIPVPLTIKENSWALLQNYYPDLMNLTCYRRNDKNVRYLTPHNLCYTEQKVSYLIFPCIGNTLQLKKISPLDCLQRLIASNMLLPQPFSLKAIEQLLTWINKTPAYEFAYTDLNSAIDLLERELLCLG